MNKNDVIDATLYDIEFLEAYLECVAKAVDDKGRRLVLPYRFPEFAAISRSLLANLPASGYKIVKAEEK